MNENEQQINDLKESLREVMMLVAERGQPLSPDLKTLLVQVMEHVANRIQQLRGQEQFPSTMPQLDAAPYPSSNINSFKYDYDTGNLLVKFMGKDSANSGPVYSYSGVPKFVYDIFRKGAVGPKTSGSNKYHQWIKGVTPSLGAAMYHLIRDNYQYQKVA